MERMVSRLESAAPYSTVHRLLLANQQFTCPCCHLDLFYVNLFINKNNIDAGVFAISQQTNQYASEGQVIPLAFAIAPRFCL